MGKYLDGMTIKGKYFGVTVVGVVRESRMRRNELIHYTDVLVDDFVPRMDSVIVRDCDVEWAVE